jgi:hypothetical protein
MFYSDCIRVLDPDLINMCSDCMYEPNVESAYLTDCVPKLLTPVQLVAYGLPVLMFVT